MAAVILLLTSVPATAGQGKTAAMTFIDNAMTPRTAAMGGISSGTAPDAGFQLDNIAAIPFFDVTFCGGITYSGWQPSTADAKTENRWDRHSLAAAVEGQAYFGGLPAGGCSVGAEYGFNSIAALRAGYHYGSNKNGLPSYASIGAGLSLYGITVDAAYLIAPARSAMHNTFMVGIGYRF